MAALNRIALDIGIGKQPLFAWFEIAVGQANNHDVHMRLTARFAEPVEGAMGKGDFQPVTVEQ